MVLTIGRHVKDVTPGVPTCATGLLMPVLMSTKMNFAEGSAISELSVMLVSN